MASLKRYLLFSGTAKAPVGGWGDYVNSFDTLPEAIAAGHATYLAGGAWWHVIDSASGDQVADQAGVGSVFGRTGAISG